MKLALGLVLVPALALAAGPPKPAKPSAEIIELAGYAAGTWKCSGKILDDDGKTMIDTKFTVVNKLDLDKWWLQSTTTGTVGKDTMKLVSYAMFSAADSKFHRFTFDNQGAYATDIAISLDHGMADKAGISWEGDIVGPTATVKAHRSEAWSKAGYTMFVEVSLDGGKTFVKGFDATCKK